ncbi:alpha/beta fold hydrolase [Streptomyces canus]|uniref:alpha/beta fold hydrolase n=1 Tax=Streptomyces canus TaxID=58343 RepID=UPI00277D3491|nr:alpha/beta hydrolase [Streptomyces canus]MDQ0765661.1 pimeloyl-ACP methyl ester carboxylesterase [Streptomyces canus]
MVTDDGARLTVYTDGPLRTDVTVILSHGFMVTADAWRIQARALSARGLRVVRYDQRAHGHSTGGETAPTIDRLGADLATVISTTAPHGPVVLAGHSMGGMATLAMAVRQPLLIKSRLPRVALISTACSKAQLLPGNHPLHWAKAAARASYSYPVCWLPPAADVVRRRLPSRHPWALRRDAQYRDDVPPPSRQAIRRTHTEPIARLWKSLRSYTTAERLHALEDLGDRVEIITGESDDWIPLSQTRELAQQLPNARLHEPVSGAGHRLPSDRVGHAVVTQVLIRMAESALGEAEGMSTGQTLYRGERR